jgi:MORN repeat variant.
MELGKDTYVNGQKIYELKDNQLTFYYKDGKLKAQGPFENGMLQGKWTFYRATGQLWEIGHFKTISKTEAGSATTGTTPSNTTKPFKTAKSARSNFCKKNRL